MAVLTMSAGAGSAVSNNADFASPSVRVHDAARLNATQQALHIRATWMRLAGFSEDEIREACADDEAVNLEEEERNLAAAQELPRITPPAAELEKWSIKF